MFLSLIFLICYYSYKLFKNKKNKKKYNAFELPAAEKTSLPIKGLLYTYSGLLILNIVMYKKVTSTGVSVATFGYNMYQFILGVTITCVLVGLVNFATSQIKAKSTFKRICKLIGKLIVLGTLLLSIMFYFAYIRGQEVSQSFGQFTKCSAQGEKENGYEYGIYYKDNKAFMCIETTEPVSVDMQTPDGIKYELIDFYQTENQYSLVVMYQFNYERPVITRFDIAENGSILNTTSLQSEYTSDYAGYLDQNPEFLLKKDGYYYIAVNYIEASATRKDRENTIIYYKLDKNLNLAAEYQTDTWMCLPFYNYDYAFNSDTIELTGSRCYGSEPVDPIILDYDLKRITN